MRRLLLPLAFGFGFVITASGSCTGRDEPSRAAATSPDGRIRVEISLDGPADGGASPTYSVSYRGRTVVRPSRLGIDLADGAALGRVATIEGVRTRSIDETYTQHPGKRSRVVDRGEEVTVTLRERAAPARRWEVVLRAYDDGAALRYRFPAQEGWPSLAIAGERTRIHLPDDAVAYALPLDGYTTSHEARYQKRRVAEIPRGVAPRIADARRIAGHRLAGGDGGRPHRLRGDVPGARRRGRRRAGDPALPAARRAGGRRPGRPSARVALADLHDRRQGGAAGRVGPRAQPERPLRPRRYLLDPPGKTTFPWWNGFHEEKVPFKMGLNTETAKYYIDFCAEAGIPYHSLDGLDNVAWYGGPIVPYEGADITRGGAGLDLREVLRYAASKGVKIRLWMHWRAAEAHMDRAFPLYREWGVEGVMLDFMDRDDQEMVNFLRRALEKAAANRLTVTLHGVAAPTGLERTFPNLLTNEGVLNLEYDKWDKQGVPPEHELTVAFTRMLAGPLDFHQGSLRGVPVEQFRPRNEAPLVIGTPCRMLACYVVFQNHLPMVADYPSAYRGHPALPVLAAIPTTWDDTRCLAGKVGELIVIARRRGAEWWVGAMGGREAREVEVPLGFLGPGRFRAELYRDDLGAAFRMSPGTKAVAGADVLRARLAPAGGLLVRLTPVKDGPG